MDQPLEVANRVVFIQLGIAPHRLAVVRVGETDPKGVVPRRLRLISLTDMFASGGFDEAIDGIVDIIRMRLDNAVVEINRLLGVVLDMADVAGWVVGVAEVLQDRIVGCSPGPEADQAEGVGIILILRCRPVAVLDPFALTLGVVVDVVDKHGRCAGIAQLGLDLLQQVRLVVAWPNAAAVRRDELDRPIERVVGRAAAEGAVSHGGILLPVHLTFIFGTTDRAGFAADCP